MSTAGHASSSSLLEGRNLLKLWSESENVGELMTDPLNEELENVSPRSSGLPEPLPVSSKNPPFPDPRSDSSTTSRSDNPMSDLAAGELGGLPKKLNECNPPPPLPKLWLRWNKCGEAWANPPNPGSVSFIPAENELNRRIACCEGDCNPC
jgi:hypothetical protein